MSKASGLLSRVANIELYNLRNICPLFSLKKSTHEYKAIKNTGSFDKNNKMNTGTGSIKMENVYFRSGNYTYIALLPYLIQKYNIPPDDLELERK